MNKTSTGVDFFGRAQSTNANKNTSSVLHLNHSDPEEQDLLKQIRNKVDQFKSNKGSLCVLDQKLNTTNLKLIDILFVKLKRDVTFKNKQEDIRMLQKIIREKVNATNHEVINSAMIDQLYGKIHKQYYEDLMMKDANIELSNCWIANANALNKFDAKSKSLLLNKNSFNITNKDYQ